MRDLYIKQQIRLYLILIIFFLTNINDLKSIENKIKFKINNEIITSLDIENEMKYLLALNPNLRSLDYKEIIKIAEKSILNEKVKEQEINKLTLAKKIPDKYLDQFLKNMYSKIGIVSLEDFKKYLKENDVEYESLTEKIITEVLWNEIILSKYSSKINIDKEALREKIKSKKKIKSFLMEEIFFEIDDNEKIEEKFKEIKNIIEINGFDNAALKFSISQTASMGGKLDWINENSLNRDIKEKVNLISIGDYTDPIRVSTGFLILKIKDIRITNLKNDINKELEKAVIMERNNQLNQFSKLYFNRVKRNSVIDEN